MVLNVSTQGTIAWYVTSAHRGRRGLETQGMLWRRATPCSQIFDLFRSANADRR